MNEFEFVFELTLVELITRTDAAHQPLTSQYHSSIEEYEMINYCNSLLIRNILYSILSLNILPFFNLI